MMILDYYNLREHPFGVTPDSRYLFLNASHREALASLLYGLDAGCGFLALIATPGLGKTTLLFHAMNQLREKAKTVFLFQTVCTPLDLLRGLLAGLGVQETQGGLVQLQLRLKEVLVEQFRLGKRVVLVIDEAQNLDDSVLELVRMLSNFETSREKLIQIILCGQPQLAEKIASPELEQLRQRVSIFAQLKPFSLEDTRLYIDHRLRTAGYPFDTPLFTRDALALIADYSDGIPRNINNLCFNSLALACALQRKPIDSDVVREVIGDLDLERFRKKSPQPVRLQERKSRAAASLRPAGSARPVFAGRIAKVALAVVVLLIVGAALVPSRPFTAQREAAVRAEIEAAPHFGAIAPSATAEQRLPQAAAPAGVAASTESGAPAQGDAASASTPSAEPAPRLADPGSTVSVTPGETLLEICVESFGRCDPDVLKEIRKLNPGLSNLDHIESGQKIHLPALPTGIDEPGKALPRVNTP